MRALLIKIHLFLAAFFSPVLVLMAVSGGLYLLGYKGQVDESPVTLTAQVSINSDAEDLKAEVDALFAANGIDHSFEYIREGGNTLTTRPTSRDYYVITLEADQARVTFVEPDLVKRMVELHKGHGPTLFKTFQKFLAAGLLLILLSGLWLGLTAPALFLPSLAASGAGLAIFLLLAIL